MAYSSSGCSSSKHGFVTLQLLLHAIALSLAPAGPSGGAVAGNVKLLEGWGTEFDFGGWVARTSSAAMMAATKQTLALGTSWARELISKMKKMAVKLLVNNSMNSNRMIYS